MANKRKRKQTVSETKVTHSACKLNNWMIVALIIFK